ncbi:MULTISPECIES: carbon-nitrogen hydrolase family protein [unclassified Leptospira]|uniref:carbon-nitrogen hydrolase family protein n=1 Tax=unclassified Leptospira TaxID=2633828 RepID=UPI0002BF739A|nr:MULTISPECIES: carbon-nitrogen hydrolase family protein [unclassified Leptospira]EMK01388.1 hydrolase, carbon-nitrogen family [Leptospira sp. B5-022]MCR1794413.1 carbon-nitrogen hydrolase family protein [Leptospira sp. id769339]
MHRFLLGLIQLNSGSDVDLNLQKCENYIREAASEGAKLVGLPENFPFLGSEKEKLERAGEIASKTVNLLSNISKKLNITVLAGGFPSPASNGKVFNTSIIFGPDGKEKFEYHKIHLFDTDPGDGIEYRESRTVKSGQIVPETYKSPELGNISSVICYDLRFPELFREIMKKDAEMIFVPSAFTKITGQAHWEILLRARAIENQCFIFAPAQTGTHLKGRETYGHSLVVDPWGNVLGDAGEGEKLLLTEIDLEEVQKVRKKIPALKHRKIHS